MKNPELLQFMLLTPVVVLAAGTFLVDWLFPARESRDRQISRTLAHKMSQSIARDKP